MIRSRRWFHGPEFLSQQKHEEESQPLEDLDNDPEVKCATAAMTVHATQAERDILKDLIEGHSSWTRLRRITAWLLRYRANLLAKSRRQEPPHSSKHLKIEELKTAERTIIKHTQDQEYRQEVRDLKSPASRVRKNSKIYKLDPTLTDDGRLVCRIRSKGFHTGQDMQGPPILPNNHHVSVLLARHYHEMSGHSGREYTVAELRQRYCIQACRSLVRRLINKCVTCRRLFAEPENQRMGDLPSERTAAQEPPFTHVGVDCFGPFATKSGRKQNKRYGCIFTCLSSRAVHLEVLESMETSSFIL